MKADANKRFFMLAELVDGSGPDLVHMPLHSKVTDMRVSKNQEIDFGGGACGSFRSIRNYHT